jgi:DNA-binding transcriptional LysR family regulator
LSAGSRKLNAPLPSVSRKVAELERHLGTQLIIRTSRHIQLTDAGRDYVEASRHIVAQIKDAELRASGEYEAPRGKLRITVPDELGRRMVLPLAYEFLCEHSEITLEVITTNSFIDLVEERIDIGIRIGHLPDSSLCAVCVGTVRILTCASPKYLERMGTPRTLADLAAHDAIQLGNFGRAWITAGSTPAETVPVTRVLANDATAACDAAVSGLGIIRLPNFIINDHLSTGALVEILEDDPADPLPVHIIYMKQGLLPLKVRAFIDWMTPRLRRAVKACDRS